MSRTIGKVTTASATGGGVGAALAAIIVWLLNQAGVEASAIESAISVVLSAGLAVLGGYLVPGDKPDTDGKHLAGPGE